MQPRKIRSDAGGRLRHPVSECMPVNSRAPTHPCPPANTGNSDTHATNLRLQHVSAQRRMRFTMWNHHRRHRKRYRGLRHHQRSVDQIDRNRPTIASNHSANIQDQRCGITAVAIPQTGLSCSADVSPAKRTERHEVHPTDTSGAAQITFCPTTRNATRHPTPYGGIESVMNIRLFRPAQFRPNSKIRRIFREARRLRMRLVRVTLSYS